MEDYFNLNNTFDIIKYFSESGALAYTKNLSHKDLSNTPSHEDNVSFLEINDIHIQKMNNTDKKSLADKDGARVFTLKISGE